MAISGGPFIGLTGTVFGVMETFSGVAQAGQANLSAMAPGVAGALVNTIVGLVVAIPALFAYNLITKGIQGIQVGLQGFAGDLEARIIAEHYGDGRTERESPKLAATH
jgi:biopolymer transport protein ExbB/TolQ